MRKAILPSGSPTYEFGNVNYELQILNESLHNKGSGFCMEPKAVLDNENQQRVENYSFPSFQSALQPAAFPSSVFSSCDLGNITHQYQSMLLGKKIWASQLDVDFHALRNAKKRPIVVNNDMLAKSGISFDRTTALNERGKNKRSKVAGNYQQYWQNQEMRETLMQENKVQVLPARRSQKLTDKITALQKLVSPYGKTDTASVLQEASLYIKLLQEQIQNLFRMLSSSYDNSVRSLPHSQEAGKRRLDLRSKGLCLVPISFTQKVTIDQERLIDHKYQHY